MEKRRNKKKIAACILLPLLLAAALCFWPNTERQCRKSVVEACTTAWYAMGVPSGDTLYFTVLRGDSALSGLSPSRNTARREFRSGAFFVSYAGRLLATADSVAKPRVLPSGTLLPVLQKESARLAARMASCKEMLKEMDYYRRTHSVVDDGFHEVMAHHEWLKAQYGNWSRCKRGVDALLAAGAAEARLCEERTVSFRDDESGDSAWKTVPCRLLARSTEGVEVWQAAGGRLPEGCGRIRLNFFPYGWFHPFAPTYTWWGHWGRHGRALKARDEGAIPLLNRMRGGVPQIPWIDGAEGAPAIGPWGNLNGMWANGRFHAAPALYRLSMEHGTWAQCLWEDAKAWASDWKTYCHLYLPGKGNKPDVSAIYGTFSRGDTLFYGQIRHKQPDGEGIMAYPDGSRYSGHWKDGRRDGYGVFADSTGRTYMGRWTIDTLRRGRAHDHRGLYAGRFNRRLEAQGEGEFTGTDGSYYVGLWEGGRRNGFGVDVSPGEMVRCGMWRKGRFRGEQMLYHPERVYGIDISKYQHIHKRRRYGINWKNLRITHLGHISKKRVQGEVDYPVSFVYIKATEGITVTNPYYAQDVRAARRHGFPVGAYHFFTTRPAKRQAAYFLRKAGLRRGDLPPVLDVELSDRKIASMGGRNALFREMLVWLRIVEKRSGTTPILYVNQDFVDRYMPHAPEALKAYPVWVARYGEYRPYVHLLCWQLSPDGTVRGIRPRVDIDVFNGSQEQFRHFLRTKAVK